MSGCCGGTSPSTPSCGCASGAPCGGARTAVPPAPAAPPGAAGTPLEWFDHMVSHALAYAKEQKAAGRKIVGIMCEYTPREVIFAAGGIPVCLCGGDVEQIPAAEQVLPANLCPLIKSTYGYHRNHSNPFLEMADLLVAETTCDGKKKMYELMAEERPLYVLELPQRAGDPDALAYWTREVRKLGAELERRFGTRITDEALRAAIRRMNEERRLRRELATLMSRTTPPYTGRQLLDLKSLISCIPADVDHYREILAWAAEQRGDPALATRTRVLMTGVPVPHMSEKVVNLVEEHRGLVVAMENCTGLKPILDDIDEQAADPWQAIAAKYFHLPCSVLTPNTERLNLLRRLVREYRPQAVVELIWQACLTYDVESHRIRRLVEEELDLPYLRIETDYSPSDSARIAVRIEALIETARRRRTG